MSVGSAWKLKPISLLMGRAVGILYWKGCSVTITSSWWKPRGDSLRFNKRRFWRSMGFRLNLEFMLISTIRVVGLLRRRILSTAATQSRPEAITLHAVPSPRRREDVLSFYTVLLPFIPGMAKRVPGVCGEVVWLRQERVKKLLILFKAPVSIRIYRRAIRSAKAPLGGTFSTPKTSRL